MGRTLQEKLSQLPQERQNRIKQQAELLIAEELSLRDLRLARQLDARKTGGETSDSSRKYFAIGTAIGSSSINVAGSNSSDGRRIAFGSRVSRSCTDFVVGVLGE